MPAPDFLYFKKLTEALETKDRELEKQKQEIEFLKQQLEEAHKK